MAKVCAQLVAFFTRPLANDPSSAVTVCVTVSPFAHVTVLPALTVIVAGENRLLAIPTETLVGPAGAPGAAGVPGAGGLTAGGGGVTGEGVVGGTVAGGGVGPPLAPVTFTVPVMLPWKLHTYVNEPSVVKECTKLPPALSVPLSNEALSALTVCFDPSSFSHVTVAPTPTVMVAGEKRAPARCTVAVSGAGGVVTGGVVPPPAGGVTGGMAPSVTTIVPLYADDPVRWSP